MFQPVQAGKEKGLAPVNRTIWGFASHFVGQTVSRNLLISNVSANQPGAK